jgi:hypothetical protein
MMRGQQGARMQRHAQREGGVFEPEDSCADGDVTVARDGQELRQALNETKGQRGQGVEGGEHAAS